MAVIMKILSLYLIVVNICGFILMGYDKRKAKKNKWRVPESRMFFTAALGGSVGIWLGMQNFHHKTLHPQFKYGIPAIFAVQILLLGLLLSRPYWS